MQRTSRQLTTVRAALIAAILFIAACGDATTTQPEPIELPRAVASVEVSPRTQLTVGQVQLLSATLRAADRSILTGRAISWSSDRPDVISTTADGLVFAIQPGHAWIRATSEGVTDSIRLEVKPYAVASILITPRVASIAIGESLQFSALVLSDDGRTLDRLVTWSTSNAAIATIDGFAKLAAVTAGTVTITATSEGVSASAQITVTAPSSSISGAWQLTVTNLVNDNTRCTVTGVTMNLSLASNGRGVTGDALGQSSVGCTLIGTNTPFTTPFPPIGPFTGSVIAGDFALRSDLEPTWAFLGKLSADGKRITGTVTYHETVNGEVKSRSGVFEMVKR